MRSRSCVLALLLTPLLPAQDDTWAAALRAAERDLLKGKHGAAESTLEEIVASGEEDPAGERPEPAILRRARQGLLELRLIRGDYAAVGEAILALPEAEGREPGCRALLARARQACGAYEEAIEVWQGLAAAGDAAASFALGEALAAVGRHDEARSAWQAAAERWAERPGEDARQGAFVARCLIALGGRERIEQASALLVDSIRRAEGRPEARVTLGLLELAVYGEADGFPSGEKDLQKVLEQNGEVEEALLGLYELRSANFQLDPEKTQGFLDRALGLNPRSVPALRLRGIGFLQDRQLEEAAAVLDEALAVNPRDKLTLAHRAAAAVLLHDERGAARFRARAQALDARFAGLDTVLGDHLVALYRFADAIPHYRAALALAPDDLGALQGLGRALIYTGQGEAARGVLSQAAALQKGYVNPWRNNALAVEDLLAAEYRLVERGGFLVKMHGDDLDVLVDYLLPAVLEAREVLGAKYGHVPRQPVAIEVFHTWADFSVRTIGFRGFSALGACFGPLITMVSPGDAELRRQDFMWTATAWHEYAHVLTLALSKHRVPRWLTEGFSVYEERARDSTWERGMERELLDAWHNGEIAPVRLLNRLFRGPRILFGYYQGGLLVELLAKEHGFAKVVELLRGFGEDKGLEELLQDTFGSSSRELDARLLRWVRDEKLQGLRLMPRWSEQSKQRFLTKLARDPGDLDTRVDLGFAHLQRGNAVDAADQLRQVLTKQPKHPRGLLLHAELLRQRQAHAEALRAWQEAFALGAEDFDARIQCARVLQQQGDLPGAIDQLQRAKACWPQCTDQQVAPELLLAKMLREAGRGDEALLELKAFVRRTGRAFQPRLELAALEERNGDWAEAARLLEQAVAIDPFMRELHVRLAEAYRALGKHDLVLRELRVALAILPELDRAWLGKPKGEIPARDAASEREARARISVQLAKAHKALGQDDAARQALQRVLDEAADGEAAEEARRLGEEWGR